MEKEYGEGKVVGLFIFIVFFVSCATIIHGTRQDIGITSSPSGATVIIDGIRAGDTPLIANLSRGDDHLVKIEMTGYESYDMVLSRNVSVWIAGNIIWAGIVGLAVDALTGAMYNLTPDQIAADLQKRGMAASVTRDKIYVTVVLKPETGWKMVGKMTRSPK